MPISYSMPTRDARLNAVITALGANAVIVIGTSGLAGAVGVLATIPCANPSFTVLNGVMTLASVPRTVVASAAGNAAKAELRTAGGVTIASGFTVGIAGSGADFIINAVALSVGQTVQCTAGTITHAA